MASPNSQTSTPLQNLSSNQAYRLLAYKRAINCNAVADTPMQVIDATNYSVQAIVVASATVSLTAATGGLFTQISGSGTAILSTGALSANTGPTIVTNETVTSNAAQTVQTLYWRIAVANGNASTCDVYVYGWDLS